jgi:hypothetical protein
VFACFVCSYEFIFLIYSATKWGGCVCMLSFNTQTTPQHNQSLGVKGTDLGRWRKIRPCTASRSRSTTASPLPHEPAPPTQLLPRTLSQRTLAGYPPIASPRGVQRVAHSRHCQPVHACQRAAPPLPSLLSNIGGPDLNGNNNIRRFCLEEFRSKHT